MKFHFSSALLDRNDDRLQTQFRRRIARQWHAIRVYLYSTGQDQPTDRECHQFSRRFTLTSRYMLSFGQVFSDLARGASNAKDTAEPR